MHIFVVNKKIIYKALLMIILIYIILFYVLNILVFFKSKTNVITKETDIYADIFFRPSKFPSININKINSNLFTNSTPPSYMISNPTDTIINYYSTLRQASNIIDGMGAGCGFIGYGDMPYNLSYSFLSDNLKKQISYDEYIKKFENILHINLIQLVNINKLVYFIELETIEGNKNKSGCFAYYYGKIELIKVNDLYKIDSIQLTPEIYLCEPYHGVTYNAINYVNITYEDIIKKKYPPIYDGYIQIIEFISNDNKLYSLKFVKLSNDTDTLIDIKIN